MFHYYDDLLKIKKKKRKRGRKESFRYGNTVYWNSPLDLIMDGFVLKANRKEVIVVSRGGIRRTLSRSIISKNKNHIPN